MKGIKDDKVAVIELANWNIYSYIKFPQEFIFMCGVMFGIGNDTLNTSSSLIQRLKQG